MLGTCIRAQEYYDDVPITEAKNLPQIYTEWANYYLERAKSKKKVSDLSIDCRDGLLLADIIEAVTTYKVPDLIKKPKTQQQMYDNVNSCLNHLRLHSVNGLETIAANDICSGRLKAVLALFFALSRYKQATKQKLNQPLSIQQLPQQQQQQQQQSNCTTNASQEMTNRQLSVSHSKVNSNGTAIPLPATVLVTRRCPPDKIRPLPPTPGHTTGIPCAATKNGQDDGCSRPTSPTVMTNGTPTYIPKGGNSFRSVQSECKIPTSPYTAQNTAGNHLPNGFVPNSEATTTKHSMLDKLKLFNKDKSDRSSKTHVSKRTSSSSGFSSARSERSDSSLSLNDLHQQNATGKLLSNGKKTEEVSGAKLKNKLLISSSKNQAKVPIHKSSKTEKKEKSPVRTDPQVIPPKTSKFSSKVDAKAKVPVVSSKKCEIRTENKNSLSQLPQQKLSVTVPGTNIPKPMALIKGTSKPQLHATKVDHQRHPLEKQIDLSTKNISEGEPTYTNHMLIPAASEDAVNHNPHHQAPLHKTDISSSNCRNLKLAATIDPGTIYRPIVEIQAEVDLSKNPGLFQQLQQQQQQQTCLNPSKRTMSASDQGILLTNNHKFHTIPSKAIHGTIFEEEKQMTIVPPMRPLLRGYSSHVTLPTRGARGQHIVSEYCEDINQGYCSDGDALKKIPSSIRCVDIDNGYMSEGGGAGCGGVHGKHLISIIRSRSQLPTTFEETCRRGRGENLSCVPTTTTATIPMTMDMNSPGNRNQRVSREHWSKVSDPLNSHGQKLQTPSSPTSNRKERNSPSHSRRSTSSSKSSQSRTKAGIAQNFGYVKRSNGVNNVNDIQQLQQHQQQQHQQQQQQQQAALMLGTNGVRTAHVSAVPRSNKVKVSGGTQTCSADLQTKIPPNTRSFSLTGPGAAQLSQSIRERLSTGSHSLPKPGSELLMSHRIQHRGSPKMTDGSLSDTQAYAEVKTDYSSYAMWLKHSNTASSRLSEGESVESLGTPISHKIIHRESPRLNRSNSIRSTKSEKMYPSMLSRGPDVEIEPYYCLPIGSIHSNSSVPWSQPTSPTPPNRCLGGPLSPTYANHRLNYQKKNDDVHGSAASLLSGGSSLYGSAEERQATEVRRLKRELCDAREQVMSLSSQLSTNAHVVAAFEQSLSNMTQRLQQLSATADRKDSELTEMRQTIELLRKQSIQAGLTSAHIHSMNEQPNHHRLTDANASTETSAAQQSDAIQRHHSSDSMCSLNSISSGCSAQDKKKKKGWLRNSFTKAFSRNAKISKASRNSSMASNLDTQNTTLCDTTIPQQLSPTKTPHKTVTIIENAKPVDALEVTEGSSIVEDLKKQLREKDLVLTDIRLEALSSASQLESLKDTVVKMRQEMINLKQNNERLQKLVTSRSLAGSEVSLGGPISPSGSIAEPRRYSLADGSLRAPLELPKSLDETEEENIPPAPAPEPPPALTSPTLPSKLTSSAPDLDATPIHISTPADDIADHTDGKKISIAVYLGQPESFQKYAEEIQETDPFYIIKQNEEPENSFDSKPKSYVASNRNEFNISFTYISGKTTWQNLDYIVRKTFKDYLARIDPGTNLGLNTDSITSYHLGEAKRGPEMGYPELLPCGYIVGNIKTLYICLQGVGSLAFESLIPRSIVHRYISLLTEHRRLILCGPSGTGKSYLARKLAEFLVTRSQRGNPSEAIATFNVDHKSSKELRQYLGHIAEQASLSNGASELPSVIILDNLHHASALSDVFQVLLSAGPAAKLPCIIGTMLQATCNTTNLQLHHNFRWVLTANHMEPVKGFLGRFLRRRLFSLELATQTSQPKLSTILAWLPTVWQHINRFLETHSSSDVTIGPRLFLSCPLDLKDSQVWFTDVWNYHLEPYLVEAVREGVQLYGRRGGEWVDPSTFIRDTYPWPTVNGSASMPSLRLISAEDVGLEGNISGNLNSQDPLLNMLMRLQEAANYSGNQEQESDCASLDSNITQDSSAGAE